ncbi:PQQ-binding-like beta-propeller repeat protein [Streptomyces ficellus]|uniref:PQQ-binding-like beta-propeller repeat protein n=1 Tax=Streptomyces ficellus TaxID=1977088 RepID=A0ABT7Z565_9ACTN|nr:PQQ-binding-like beta-propeller repeat protein [Streptomyces ficellus]MDN3294632.1 PQQ-binding-like beta-propeller repeat protein [Streptomyces ficellus]
MRSRRPLTALATAALIGGALTACGGSDEAGAGGGGQAGPKASPSASASPSPAPRKSYDPPVRFDARKDTRLPDALKVSPEDVGQTRFSRASFALHKGIAYAADGKRVSAYDTANGKVVWSAPLSDRPVAEVPVPVVVQLPGRTVVIAAVRTVTGGTGTSKESASSTAVVAFDPRSGAKQWSEVIDAPGMLIGADSSAAVFSDEGSVWALDPATGKKLWDKQGAGLTDPVYSGGAVIGVVKSSEEIKVEPHDQPFTPEFTRLVGLSPKDGGTLWEQYARSNTLKARSIGTGTVQVEATYSSPFGDFGDDSVDVIDARTGKPRVRLPLDGSTDTEDWVCAFDERGVVVCGIAYTYERVHAYDAISGKQLWALPTEDRKSLEVTAVWHGAVYGEVEGGGPVVLDARTGADREVKPGVAPALVDGTVGLVKGNMGSLEAYPAVG